MKAFIALIACSIMLGACSHSTESRVTAPVLSLTFGATHRITLDGKDRVSYGASYNSGVDSIVSVTLNGVRVNRVYDPPFQFTGPLYFDGTANTVVVNFTHSTFTRTSSVDVPLPVLRSPASGTILQRAQPFTLHVDSLPTVPGMLASTVMLSDDSGTSRSFTLDSSGTVSLPELSQFKGTILHVDVTGNSQSENSFDRELVVSAFAGVEKIVDFEMR